MLEHQFIQFSESNTDQCDIALPVVFGREGTSVFVKCDDADDINVTLVDPDATQTYASTRVVGEAGWNCINISQLFTAAAINAVMADGALFRIVLDQQSTQMSIASQILCNRRSTDGLSVIKYKCNPDAFGFPFAATSGYAIATLPILLSQPQYGQEDKVYTKSNGDVVVLYAQYRKEWSGETEYLPERIHDKIVTALACDEIYINGERVTKNGNYEVDWENYDRLPDETKTARATFKVQANTLSRNSNY